MATNNSINNQLGTIVADNAVAGYVGEFVTSAILQASGISYTPTSLPKNLTSISLTAGDWNVWGNIVAKPAGTTTVSFMQVGINTVTNTMPDGSLTQVLSSASFTTGGNIGLMAPLQRINVSTTTTVYIVTIITFGVSTITISGNLSARRVR